MTLLSVTEGDDKPAKYPVMFRAADLMLLSKMDLLAVLDDFDPGKAEHHLRHLANDAPVIQVSAKQADAVSEWLDWLRAEISQQRQRLKDGVSLRPAIQPDGLQLHGSQPKHTHHHHEHG